MTEIDKALVFTSDASYSLTIYSGYGGLLFDYSQILELYQRETLRPEVVNPDPLSDGHNTPSVSHNHPQPYNMVNKFDAINALLLLEPLPDSYYAANRIDLIQFIASIEGHAILDRVANSPKLDRDAVANRSNGYPSISVCERTLTGFIRFGGAFFTVPIKRNFKGDLSLLLPLPAKATVGEYGKKEWRCSLHLSTVTRRYISDNGYRYSYELIADYQGSKEVREIVEIDVNGGIRR